MKKNKQTNVKTEGEKISKLINKHHEKKKKKKKKKKKTKKKTEKGKLKKFKNK